MRRNLSILAGLLCCIVNAYAQSVGGTVAGRMLYHDLRTKPQRVAAEVSLPVTTRDSVVVMTREVETPVLVEK